MVYLPLFTHIWLKQFNAKLLNVGKYNSPMDPMGYRVYHRFMIYHQGAMQLRMIFNPPEKYLTVSWWVMWRMVGWKQWQPMRGYRIQSGKDTTRGSLEMDVNGTVDGSEIRLTTWDVQNPVNIGINTDKHG